MELDKMKQDLSSVVKGGYPKSSTISQPRKIQKSNKPKLHQISKIQWILPFCELKLGDYRTLNKEMESQNTMKKLIRIEEIISKFSKRNSPQFRMLKKRNHRFVPTKLTAIYEDIEYR